MGKRSCAIGMTVISIAAGLVAVAAPASAAGGCYISVPAHVSIKSGFTTITARPQSNCAASDMAFAEWNVSPSNFGNTFFFTNGSLNSNYTFYSSVDRVGVLTAVSAGASSSTGVNDLAQNNPTFPVKYGTWAYVASTRSGTAVHIGGLIHQWTSNDLASPSGRRVFLQRYINHAWQNMVSQLTISSGRISFGFIKSTVVQYRLTVTETGTAWSGASSSTFR